MGLPFRPWEVCTNCNWHKWMLVATKPTNSLHAIRSILFVLISFILSRISLGARRCSRSNSSPSFPAICAPWSGCLRTPSSLCSFLLRYFIQSWKWRTEVRALWPDILILRLTILKPLRPVHCTRYVRKVMRLIRENSFNWRYVYTHLTFFKITSLSINTPMPAVLPHVVARLEVLNWGLL